MSNNPLEMRARDGLGGSHTVVTAVPLDALETVNPNIILSDVTSSELPINIYAHVAFCEHICPFCHYATTKTGINQESQSVASYMDALWKEFDFWAQKLERPNVNSIYIGGGTPTALSEHRLVATLDRVQNISAIPVPNICVEASPLTLIDQNGTKKLSSLITSGTNRISMGLQSFDEEVLRRSRNHGQAEALKAMEILATSSVDYNIDLIQDLPGQTRESIIDDIAFLEKFKPPQVTWYIFRLHEGSIWHKMNTTGRLENDLTSEESLSRRRLIREKMAEIGYTPSGGGRFTRNDSYDQYKTIRSGAETTMLGMGLSAYSHGWGWFFRNSAPHQKGVPIKDYAALINTQGHAIQSGHKMQEVDLLAAKVTSGIRSEIVLPYESNDPRTQNYIEQTNEILMLLLQDNLVQKNERGAWALTENGRLFEEEICSLFYTQEMKQRLGTRLKTNQITSSPQP